MSERIFACKITDLSYLSAFAPEQPETIAVGQEWMRAPDGATLPVKRVRPDYIDLGGDSYTLVLTPEQLRAAWVCIDAPDNVRAIGSAASRIATGEDASG